VNKRSRNPLAAVLGPIVSGSTWRRVISACLNLWVMIIPIVVVSVGISLAAGLAIFVFPGVFILLATFTCTRLFGRLERARLNHLLDAGILDPHRPLRPGSFWNRFGQRFTSAASWKEVAYWPVHAIAGSITFAFVTAVWVGAGVFIASPLYVRHLPEGRAHLLVAIVSSSGQIAVLCATGVVLLLAAPWVTRGLTGMDAALGRGLLGRRRSDELEERVDVLQTTRARAVDSAEAELRRIERDLHDGAQARLVALAMDLGMAREKMIDDPVMARGLIDEAHQEAKRAIVELRDLARGIHPAVLADRGLDPALSSLVSRARVPVELTVDVSERPPATTESIAYFIVAEALTNIAKHAHANAASVSVVRRGPSLVLEISDDGVGGADVTKGTGLAGLADRVSAVDGYMDVSSPIGGPTIILVELPCAS
jgi:signal transduction histidine kinase